MNAGERCQLEVSVEVELTSGTPADLSPTVGPKRGVVVVPDALGRRPLLTDLAQRLSTAHNWNVILVDVYRGRAIDSDSPEALDRAIAELDDDDVVGDLVDAAARLEADPVALLGIGLGGMYAYKAAASHRFDRVVSLYGMIEVPQRWRGPGQRSPLALIEHAADPAAILALYGGADPWVTSDQVDALERTGVEVVRYAQAAHGFVHDPADSAHRAADAADVWARVVKHLTL
jgi:carboxymethylenebutenolidase